MVASTFRIGLGAQLRFLHIIQISHSNQAEYPTTSTLTPSQIQNVNPSIIKSKGRPRNARLKSAMERGKGSITYKCGKCGGFGHTARSRECPSHGRSSLTVTQETELMVKQELKEDIKSMDEKQTMAMVTVTGVFDTACERTDD